MLQEKTNQKTPQKVIGEDDEGKNEGIPIYPRIHRHAD